MLGGVDGPRPCPEREAYRIATAIDQDFVPRDVPLPPHAANDNAETIVAETTTSFFVIWGTARRRDSLPRHTRR
jgi:hypothetical protein